MDILKIYDEQTSTWKTIPAITGEQGVSVTNASINGSGHLIITLSNGTTIDTGVAKGTDGTNGVGISSITKTSTSGLVDTYTISYTNGTTSTFTVTNGADGEDGADGVSPNVTIAEISGGHSVTITDAEHPSGQTFDVMDGEDGTIINVGGSPQATVNFLSDPQAQIDELNEDIAKLGLSVVSGELNITFNT